MAKKYLVVNVSDEFHEQVKELAKSKGLSIQKLIIESLKTTYEISAESKEEDSEQVDNNNIENNQN